MYTNMFCLFYPHCKSGIVIVRPSVRASVRPSILGCDPCIVYLFYVYYVQTGNVSWKNNSGTLYTLHT